MKDFIELITAYNLFNYLLPGTVFCILAHQFTPLNLVQPDLLVGAFVYYFVGLVISRIGSLLIGPLCKRTRFVQFAAYPDFLTACQCDAKIETLSQENNMYRTICAMVLLLLGVKIWISIPALANLAPGSAPYVLMGLLLVLFLFSYRKQTRFITHRVQHGIKKEAS